MATILARQTATITELREPQKVLDRAGGQPVAILKNSQVVGYLVPAAHVEAAPTSRYATAEEVAQYLEASRERVQPVLDYLRDK
ncbi:MAG TPA: hypothetical protein PKD10_05440 [Paracoccaceae bacterium]|nr:hypothetical protein [Paracoccaceae bacterium]HMO72536.1 hypothetical protein [Paracoccaceae bacterium]